MGTSRADWDQKPFENCLRVSVFEKKYNFGRPKVVTSHYISKNCKLNKIKQNKLIFKEIFTSSRYSSLKITQFPSFSWFLRGTQRLRSDQSFFRETILTVLFNSVCLLGMLYPVVRKADTFYWSSWLFEVLFGSRDFEVFKTNFCITLHCVFSISYWRYQN